MVYTETDIINAVFKITAPKPGTCFLIRNQGNEFFFLTAAHVVNNSDDVKVTRVGSTNIKFDLKVIQRIENHDIALLYGADLPISSQTIPLELSDNIRANMTFSSYGFPSDVPISTHSGKIMNRRADSPEYEVLFDNKYEHHLGGLSGAPVYNDSFQVIGVMTHHLFNELQHGRMSPYILFGDKLNFAARRPDFIPCLVVLSENERNQTGRQYSLTVAVRETLTGGGAVRFYGKRIEPELIFASDVFASEQSYVETVKKLCEYEIAVFDLTDYEPALMILLGIRSVVRRGVTIVSMGGDFTLGNMIDLPFNIKEVNVIPHSTAAARQENRNIHPRVLLRKRIEQGLEEYLSPEYQDLTTFAAVRNLPPTRREKIPYDKGILLLCSYSPKYQKTNWDFIREGFMRQNDPEIPVYRVLDFADTGQLVSNTMYAYIRRMDLAIIDWTEWRPNVFFETGVRLAIGNSGTYILVEKNNLDLIETALTNVDNLRDHVLETLFEEQPTDSKLEEVTKRIRHIAPQCQQLVKFFSPNEYECIFGKDNPYYNIIDEHANIQQGVASYQQTSLIMSKTYETVSEFIDPITEYTSIPVHKSLLASADLYDVYSIKGISSVLYPKLHQQAEQATLERLFATWYYITNRYTTEQIERDEDLLEAYWDVRYRLGDHLSEQEWNRLSIKPISKTVFLGIKDLLENISIMKNRAKTSRNENKFEEALKDLDDAIRFLLNAHSDLTLEQAGDKEKIESQISDCYGMMGGVYGRMKNPEKAREMYKKGLEYEKDDSYNRVNALVTELMLDPLSYNTPRMRGELVTARDMLINQTKGKRGDQWWAWADMGLLHLLNEDIDNAKEAYSNFRKFGASAQSYDSTIRVLDDLRGALAPHYPYLGENINMIIQYLEDEKQSLNIIT
ncbi:MAG: trypsin-like peptidase domain-containing protein [Anaerolineae bacterium]|nr:trypsin-like peptidase domain-containing protein [Anaerolineae bacterium]